MKIPLALVLAFSSLPAAAGPVEVRTASPATVQAVQAVLASPAGAQMSAENPALGRISSLDPSDAQAQAALGVLAAHLPEGFEASVAAAAAGPAGAASLGEAAGQLRSAYARSALVAPHILEGKIRRLGRLRAKETLSAEELDRAFDGLGRFAIYGGATARRLEGLAVARTVTLPRLPAGFTFGNRIPRHRIPPRAPQPDERPAKAGELVTIPAGTPVPVRLDFTVDDATPGDATVFFSGAQKVGVPGATPVLLPTAYGLVTRVRRPGLFGRTGEVAVVPTHVFTADGQTVRLEGGEVSAHGALGRNLLHALGPVAAGAFGAWLLPHVTVWMFLGAAGLSLLLLAMPGWGARLRYGELAQPRTAEDVTVRVTRYQRVGRVP